MRYAIPMLIVCLAGPCCPGEGLDKDEARTKPIEASDFEDIVNNFGYLLDGVKRVVWILDQSPSMADDIAEVRKRIEPWLEGLDRSTKVGVVVFSQKPQVILPLSNNHTDIKAAFDKYSTVESGQENVYLAIAEALKMLPGKETSAVLVATDEAGDDDKHLAAALNECKARTMQFYALTPHASFGNKLWKWSETNYQAKSTKKYVSSNGPETFTPEALFCFHFVQRTNWWTDRHPRETRVWAAEAGWAPFGLQVLTEGTGGRIYELKTDTCKLPVTFDEQKKPRYRPDLDPAHTQNNIQRTPWRLAVHMAAEQWQKQFKEIERVFPGAGKKAFLSNCARQVPAIQNNQRVAEQVLGLLAAALKNKEGCRSKDDSPDARPHLRWRANIELAYASALVARFHLHQILADFARFQQPAFEVPGVQAETYGYILDPVPDPSFNTDGLSGTPDPDGLYHMLDSADHTQARTLEEMRKQAETALAVVGANHADTPWAAMAAHLKSMLGHYDPNLIRLGDWSHGSGNK